MFRSTPSTSRLPIALGTALVGLILLFLPIPIQAQPALPCECEVVIGLPVLPQLPPLRTDMSADVIRGYLYTDSLAHLVTHDAAERFLASLTLSDTLDQLLYYLYSLDDANPIAFQQYVTMLVSEEDYSYRSRPSFLYRRLLERVAEVAPDSNLTYTLTASNIVAHVRATQVEEYQDGKAALHSDQVHVTCTIIDPIKGQYVPTCLSGSEAAEKPFHTGTYPTPIAAAAPGVCLEFNYASTWSRVPYEPYDVINYDSILIRDDGSSWIQPGDEFILFLRFVTLTSDDSVGYYTLFPVLGGNRSGGMFRVENGIVLDSRDDFGFGTGLTLETFKANLRNRIAAITDPTHRSNFHYDITVFPYPYPSDPDLSFGQVMNLPNPFATHTTIVMTVPKEAHIELALYNALGQRVHLLRDEVFSVGEHRIEFDGSDLPGGVYWCRMNVEGQTTSTKMLILRH